MGGITGDHHLGVETLTRQNHLHLFRRCVLRFVENDEAIVQRAAAHEGDRCDFDRVALQQFLDLFRLDHFVERIVKRAYVRIDLFLERPRKETQALSRFDSGTSENDAAHALAEKGGHGHRHG